MVSVAEKVPVRIKPGGIDTMGDLLHIARDVGRRKLKCDKVRVLPEQHKTGNGCYIVLVEPVGGSADVADESDDRAHFDVQSRGRSGAIGQRTGG